MLPRLNLKFPRRVYFSKDRIKGREKSVEQNATAIHGLPVSTSPPKLTTGSHTFILKIVYYMIEISQLHTQIHVS